MVDKSTNDKKPEETVTVEEEDLFEDFPLGKGKYQCPVGFELLLARISMLGCMVQRLYLRPSLSSAASRQTMHARKNRLTTINSSTLQGHRQCSLGTGRRRQSSHCGKQTGMMRMWEAATLCSISKQS